MSESDAPQGVVERIKAEFDREQRLLKLEKRVSIGLVALLALGAIELVVATRTFLSPRRVTANNVTAGEFTLVDREGRKRGSFELSGGSPRLALLGEDGEQLVDLSIAHDGPRLSLEDRTARMSVSLATAVGLTIACTPNKAPLSPSSTFSVGFSSFGDDTGATVFPPRLCLTAQGQAGPWGSATLSFDRHGPFLELRDGAGNVVHRQP